MERPAIKSVEEERFFTGIRDRVAFVVEKRIGSEDAEEVIQNAMVEIRSRIQEVSERPFLMSLVFSILRTCIRDYYQKKKREEKVLNFSQDAFYYYQTESTDLRWQEIAETALKKMESENSSCAEIYKAFLTTSNKDELQQELNLESLNLYRRLFRCRENLLKLVTQTLKISLP